MLWTSYGLCQRDPFIQGTNLCSVLSHYDIRDRSRANGEALFPVGCCVRAQVWDQLTQMWVPTQLLISDMGKTFRPHFPFLRNGDKSVLHRG